MTEGKEIHYSKMTLFICSIIFLIIVALLVVLGIWVCFTFGGYYLLLASVIFIVAIILGAYCFSMFAGFIALNKAQELISEHNYCPKCNRELQAFDKICPYCGKKINKWYVLVKEKNNEVK